MTLTRQFSIGPVNLGGNSPLFVIIGPCVIESANHCLFLARELKEIAFKAGVPFIFKASFDKANRTSIASFRGPGLRDGLEILKSVREQLSIPVLTDIHDVSQVDLVSRAVDCLQIPAFLSRQTDLLLSAGLSGCAVNVKKGQFLAPWDMRQVANKLASTGNSRILLTERGTSFGYNNLVVDMRSFPIMREIGYPVVFDVTHSLQLPGGQGTASGGQPQFIEHLARAGVAAGVDGVFMEVHENPLKAMSDGSNALRLDHLEKLLCSLKSIDELVKDRKGS
jgi:2-dehydro-3-deoxyphosphooctonate aldolase (KDO 8-P synthase)